MNTYVQFLSLFGHAIEQHYELDSYVRDILEFVAVYNHQQNKPIQCNALLQAYHLGSPATIHKNYIRLVHEGYLKQIADPNDKRVKYIDLGTRGKNYFNKINELMLSCLQECKNNQKKIKK
jgi:hypothetical protein